MTKFPRLPVPLRRRPSRLRRVLLLILIAAAFVRVSPNALGDRVTADKRAAAAPNPAQPNSATTENSEGGPKADGGGAKVVGEAPKGPWKKLTADEQTQAVQELDAFADKTQATMQLKLSRRDPTYFLFYSDLPNADAKRAADLLDRMYTRLADLFGTGKRVNIWRGKALVFVFTKQDDYLRFQRLMHNTDARGTFGMCHTFGNGDVHIAFFRQPDAGAFKHVLVHESVHGFLHRFKTPASIPSWVNEGLAEAIADELVPDAAGKGNAATAAAAKSAIEQHGNRLDGMFDAKSIADWQYPVAESVTQFMIEHNKSAYVNFVTGMKEGMSCQDALAKKFNADREGLLRAYADAMKIKDLKE